MLRECGRTHTMIENWLNDKYKSNLESILISAIVKFVITAEHYCRADCLSDCQQCNISKYVYDKNHTF